jgi:hypothetical protein
MRERSAAAFGRLEQKHFRGDVDSQSDGKIFIDRPGSPWELTKCELRCNPRGGTEVRRNGDYVVTLIWNGNFQNLFLSPLIGAVMGLILTYLFTPPLDDPTNVNIAYSQVVKIFHTEIHHHYHGSKSEDREAFGFGLILMAVSAWLYLDHGQTVLAVITFVAAFILVSSATFIMMRLLARAGEGWLFRLAWPAVVAVLAAILVLQEQAVVDYLVANGVNFRYFVSMVGSEFFTTMLYHTIGMPFLVGALAFSIIALLHQIALGSLTNPEDIYSFRGWIIRKTLRIGGPSGFAMSFFFLGMSWLCLSGKALDLVHQLTDR